MGRPVFPGASTTGQIVKILELIGRPSIQEIESVNSAYASTLLEMLPIVRPVSFVEMFPNVSAEALNFLSHCQTLTIARKYPPKKSPKVMFTGFGGSRYSWISFCQSRNDFSFFVALFLSDLDKHWVIA